MKCTSNNPIRVGKPKWLRRKLPSGPEYEQIRKMLKKNSLNTVCQEAQCPNQFECYSSGTATFMILGEKCTRNCSFCAVQHSPMGGVDESEPHRVAETVKQMELKYVVVTSVTRDDLADGGAHIFVNTIKEIRSINPLVRIEILIPDLQGAWQHLEQIVHAQPDVLNHNLETVERLYPTVRPQAIYERSLELLKKVKDLDSSMITKSGIMLGLGEYEDELKKSMDDLLSSGCDILTLGQYLQPSKNHLPVEEFVPPEKFSEWKEFALQRGFTGVASGPTVRSSYDAEAIYKRVKRKITHN